MSLGKRIARRMKELQLTQMQLAHQAGVTQQTISKYVRDGGKPTYDAIVALSEALAVPPAWFFSESEAEALLTDGLLRRTFPSRRSAALLETPSTERSRGEKRFIIGHFLPMQQMPFPIQRSRTGIVTTFYGLIFQPLVRCVDGKCHGVLAVDWKGLETRWVFQLRDGVSFHDGAPLTTEDMRWSYEQYLLQNPKERFISGVQVIDAHLIALQLHGPCRLEDLAMPLILPAGTFDSPTQWGGTGPFCIVELNPGVWRLRRNPHSFLQLPAFETVEIREYGDEKALADALHAGEVHFALGVSLEGEDFVVTAEATTQRYHLRFLLQDPLVQNLDVRKAIALALDTKALAQAAGLKNPLYSSGPFDALIGDRMSEPPSPDVEAAKRLLEQAPHLADSPFRVNAYPTDPKVLLLAKAIVEQLTRIGMPAAIEEPPHALVLVRHAGDFELESRIWSMDDQYNVNGYSHREVDDTIRRLKQTSPSSSQLRELRRLIQKDLPDFPLFYDEMPLTYVKRLHTQGNQVPRFSHLFDLHTWYLDPTRLGSLCCACVGVEVS